MLSSRSLVKKELIHGDDIPMRPVQQNPSDLFADTSPTRLPRRNTENASSVQVPLQAPDLRSLSTAFHTLQGNKKRQCLPLVYWRSKYMKSKQNIMQAVIECQAWVVIERSVLTFAVCMLLETVVKTPNSRAPAENVHTPNPPPAKILLRLVYLSSVIFHPFL